MKKSALALGLCLALMPSMVSADELIKAEDFPGHLGANVALTTNYVFRGISQTDDGIPSIQGGIDWSHDFGVHANIWASNVKFTDASVEVDYTLGFGRSIDKFSYDISAIYYSYPGAASSLNYDYFEVQGSASYDFDLFSVGAAINYSPDYFGGSDDGLYGKISLDVPIGKYFTLGGHVGYQSIDNNTAFGVPDYLEYGVGVSAQALGFDLNLAWTDTDHSSSECPDLCGNVVFTV